MTEEHEGSYLHQDGTPDSAEDILTSARCFTTVIAKLLEPNEGMVVELEYQPQYPTDPCGKFLVWKDAINEQIKVNWLTPEDDEYTFDHGQMVWVDIEEYK